jgi:predicted ATP-dependent endonuclease of OLD family
MKFRKIYIKGFDQFQDITLDFTNPSDGKALDKICLIGKNGTGKSRILKDLILINILKINPNTKLEALGNPPIISTPKDITVIIDVEFQNQNLTIIYPPKSKYSANYGNVFYSEIHEMSNWIEEYLDLKNIDLVEKYRYFEDTPKIILSNFDNVIYMPSESRHNLAIDIHDVPKSNVNDAQKLFSNIPKFHEISNSTINYFWRNVIYLMRKRDSDYKAFQNENKKKTIEEAEKLFDKQNPKFLKELSILWNKILKNANLFFDEENANDPIQLEDNLKAYIKHKGTDKTIAYNRLSTGIRDFIFKLGHIYSLYFNRNIENGLLLIDEPENSLYPDFLYEIIEYYQNITHNSQMFFATHSPIVASQFKPFERILLDFNEDGSINARKGTAPEGDDPNDILEDDFLVRNIMTKEGQNKWNRYKELKEILRNNKTISLKEKELLLTEMSEIGSLYKF